MWKLFVLLALPTLSYAAVQCYVGQKLFSFESNMAVCARFINYGCATQCEWRKSCDQHAAYNAFHGRRTFVSGLLMNSKSLMVLCCTSLSTRVESDSNGKDKCEWRETESLAVEGPSIRTNPVLAPNHYIRNIRLERDGSARVDTTLEVCQFQTEFQHCNVQNMTDVEKRRFNIIQLKLQRADTKTQISKTHDNDKAVGTETAICQSPVTTSCGREMQSQIQGCCKDRAACDRACLKNVEQSLQLELVRHSRGCTTTEVRSTLDCLGRQVNNHAE